VSCLSARSASRRRSASRAAGNERFYVTTDHSRCGRRGALLLTGGRKQPRGHIIGDRLRFPVPDGLGRPWGRPSDYRATGNCLHDHDHPRRVRRRPATVRLLPPSCASTSGRCVPARLPGCREELSGPTRSTVRGGRRHPRVVGDEPVGCVGLRGFEPPAVAELKRMYVRPGARGAGAGRASPRRPRSARNSATARSGSTPWPELVEAARIYTELGFCRDRPYRHNPSDGAFLRGDPHPARNRTRTLMHASSPPSARFTRQVSAGDSRRLDRRTGAAVHFLPTLSSVVNNNNQDFLRRPSPAVAASNLAHPPRHRAWRR